MLEKREEEKKIRMIERVDCVRRAVPYDEYNLLGSSELCETTMWRAVEVSNVFPLRVPPLPNSVVV